MRSGTPGPERRCPDCGALASSDAEWCNQCFRSLLEPDPEPEPAPVSTVATAGLEASVAQGGAPATGTAPPTWPCPVCDHRNPIEADACVVCGTTFAQMMRQDEAPPTVDPADAMHASLLFPGLGHRKVGRGLDGLARGALFVVLAAMAITVAVSGLRSPATIALCSVFVAGAVLVYAGSAWEASRMADGGGPIVSSRGLMWVTVVVIIASVMLLAMSFVTVARR